MDRKDLKKSKPLNKTQFEILTLKAKSNVEIQQGKLLGQINQKEKQLIQLIKSPTRKKDDELQKLLSIQQDKNTLQSRGQASQIQELVPFIMNISYAANKLNISSLQEFRLTMSQYLATDLQQAANTSPEVEETFKKCFVVNYTYNPDLNLMVNDLAVKYQQTFTLDELNRAGHEFYLPQQPQQLYQSSEYLNTSAQNFQQNTLQQQGNQQFQQFQLPQQNNNFGLQQYQQQNHFVQQQQWSNPQQVNFQSNMQQQNLQIPKQQSQFAPQNQNVQYPRFSQNMEQFSNPQQYQQYMPQNYQPNQNQQQNFNLLQYNMSLQQQNQTLQNSGFQSQHVQNQAQQQSYGQQQNYQNQQIQQISNFQLPNNFLVQQINPQTNPVNCQQLNSNPFCQSSNQQQIQQNISQQLPYSNVQENQPLFKQIDTDPVQIQPQEEPEPFFSKSQLDIFKSDHNNVQNDSNQQFESANNYSPQKVARKPMENIKQHNQLQQQQSSEKFAQEDEDGNMNFKKGNSFIMDDGVDDKDNNFSKILNDMQESKVK